MATVSAYWRPTSMAEAFERLAHREAVVVGGGTKLNPTPTSSPVEVVDLQSLQLDGIDPAPPGALRVGATATLQQVADSEAVPDVVREAARREQPSTLRAQATVGGCVATGDFESELLAALLAHEAVVRLEHAGGVDERPLEAVLAELPLAAGTVITAVTIQTTGSAALARAARTRADKAIVVAVARTTDGGLRTALSGVARTPVLVEGDAGMAALDPPADFRGSAGYRKAVAATLLARAVEALP